MTEPAIFISAGEASGEHYGALLIEEMKTRLPAARFFGMGGERMEALGCERIVKSEDVAVMGITEVVRHLPRIYREYRKLRNCIRSRRPSIAVLIDFPDIHLKLAEELHRLGIPVIFFVSPQLWAWKKRRIRLVQRYVDRMLVIFPFEESFYRERGVDATYVGHPLADLPLPTIQRSEFAALHGLDPESTWIGLLPGSRAREIRFNLPEMLAAARLLSAQSPGMQFLLPLAPTLTAVHRQAVRNMLRERASTISVHPIEDARGALLHARASIVASGTATVEAALVGNPFVVVYRVSPLTYAIAKRVVTVPHVAMVNLVAEKRLVPELIQSDFTAENIAQYLTPLLAEGEPRSVMIRGLHLVADTLNAGRIPGKTAISRVAAIVVEALA
uniref:lipid-A-disaccharide synthase n=1 Tax=mine drainage metagenome TaxID=410659 RepID=E6QHW1_9ZZZZ